MHEMDETEISKFQHSIITQAAKYGWENSKTTLVNYIMNGNSNVFTRDQKARDYIDSIGVSKIRDEVLLSSYADLNNKQELNQEQIVMNYISNMFQTHQMLKKQMDVLAIACYETATKYGKPQIKNALNKFIKEGNPSGITSNQNSRENMKNYVRPEDVEFMIKAGINQDRFMDNACYYNRIKYNDISDNMETFVSNVIDRKAFYSLPPEQKR